MGKSEAGVAAGYWVDEELENSLPKRTYTKFRRTGVQADGASLKPSENCFIIRGGFKDDNLWKLTKAKHKVMLEADGEVKLDLCKFAVEVGLGDSVHV